jgi:hypothetical protein
VARPCPTQARVNNRRTYTMAKAAKKTAKKTAKKAAKKKK